MKRLLTLTTVLLLAGWSWTPVHAQDRDATAPDTIEVDAGTVVLKMADGREVLVVTDDDANSTVRWLRHGPFGAHGTLWMDDDDPEVHVRRFGAGEPRAFFFDDDDDFSVELAPDAHMKGLVDGLRLHARTFDGDATMGFGAGLEERMEIARLEAESRRLAREVRQAEGAERERLRADLEAHLDDLFERKLERRRDRVGRLAEELEEAREAVEAREAARREIIERRLSELLGEDDTLDW